WGLYSMDSELTEHISREGRVRLVNLILDNGWTVSELARRLGVSRQAVYLWLDSQETHPNNSHLGDLVNLAIEVDDQSASKILLGEVNQFRLAVDEKILGQISGKDK
ncbi:hypothetical protein AKJ48_04075, partial [candidate division MSBL1 archaeon SCGC-AAA261O19]